MALCPPEALPVEVACQDVPGDQDIFDDLEIEHSDAGEIGTDSKVNLKPWLGRPDMDKCHRCVSKWDVPELTPPAWRVLNRAEQILVSSLTEETAGA